MRHSIFDDGSSFSFFQAIRVLEKMYPDRAPVGRTEHPSREVARFKAHLSIRFPASELQAVELGDGEDPQPRMRVNFMGLTGPLGVLPIRYTELLLERRSQKDQTLTEFLDIFNHRMISLFYRAWEKYRFPISFERESTDVFTRYLMDLIGLGTVGLQRRLSIPDRAILFYVGLFNQQPHSASALEGILRDYFEVPARVTQYIGRWVKLGKENESRLAVQNCTLGMNAVLGERVWDRQSKFRATLGPLDLNKFRRLLPIGDAYKSLTELVRLFAGTEYDFDFRLVLKAPQVPRCLLRSDGVDGAHLGWCAWLKTRDFKADAQDTVIASGF